MSGAPGRVTVLDLEPVNEDFLAEVLAGLSASPRSLPCKFFYDEHGAELFQKICELPEYYITRTETELLRRHGREMADQGVLGLPPLEDPHPAGVGQVGAEDVLDAARLTPGGEHPVPAPGQELVPLPRIHVERPGHDQHVVPP